MRWFTKKEIDDGIPTLAAFVETCSRFIVERKSSDRLYLPLPNQDPQDDLFLNMSDAAVAILMLAAKDGEITLTGGSTSGQETFLSVIVGAEYEGRYGKWFFDRDLPTRIDGVHAMKELCRNGLVSHHRGWTFSISDDGQRLLRQIELIHDLSRDGGKEYIKKLRHEPRSFQTATST